MSFSEIGDTASAVSVARRAVARADKLPRDSAGACQNAAWSHAVLWTVCGKAGSGVSEPEREIQAAIALSLFRHAAELGFRVIYFPLLPEPFQQRADFRLFAMDQRMPVDPFAPK
jgi:hypothetical protein